MGRHHLIQGQHRHLDGWHADRPDPASLKMSVSRFQAFLMPKSASVKKWAPPVKDQGQFGTCAAFSSCASMRTLRLKAGLAAPDFSEWFVYNETRDLEGTPLTEDSGLQIADAFKTLKRLGVCQETDFPYDPANFSVQPNAAQLQSAAAHRLMLTYRCPNLTTIKAAIAQGYPVVLGFSVPETVESDPSVALTGVISPSTPVIGGHAVHAVSYDDGFLGYGLGQSRLRLSDLFDVYGRLCWGCVVT
jgi:C1A family cysteine protease